MSEKLPNYYDYLCDGCKQRIAKAIVADAKNPLVANREWFERLMTPRVKQLEKFLAARELSATKER